MNDLSYAGSELGPVN